MSLGTFGGAFLGPQSDAESAVISGTTPLTLTFNAADTGWAHRWMAEDVLDIKAVNVNFSAVTTPGTVTCRIETVDGSTGDPTGTLYDANATKTITPDAAGWKAFTFDTLPTTGMTPGAMYAIVLIKDNAGTTCTLNARVAPNGPHYPAVYSTTATASTRSSFAPSNTSVGVCYLTKEDDSVQRAGPSCAAAAVADLNIYGADNMCGQKIVLPNAVVVRAIKTSANSGINRAGTPAGDLRVRILDATNTLVTGTSATIDKDLQDTSARGLYVPINNVTLPAGTYRIVLDSASSADTSNCFRLRYATLPVAGLQSSAFATTVTTNASGDFDWTDYQDRQNLLGLEIDSIPAAAGGGNAQLIGGGLVR